MCIIKYVQCYFWWTSGKRNVEDQAKEKLRFSDVTVTLHVIIWSNWNIIMIIIIHLSKCFTWLHILPSLKPTQNVLRVVRRLAQPDSWNFNDRSVWFDVLQQVSNWSPKVWAGYMWSVNQTTAAEFIEGRIADFKFVEPNAAKCFKTSARLTGVIQLLHTEQAHVFSLYNIIMVLYDKSQYTQHAQHEINSTRICETSLWPQILKKDSMTSEI